MESENSNKTPRETDKCGISVLAKFETQRYCPTYFSSKTLHKTERFSLSDLAEKLRPSVLLLK
ncbi:Hypothetical protein CINCED_3A007785 [Cinara cedri]|uniref:Uncharacterized protein n=1 Tax=Cinara cedri TaxID=506608 RepID=A0A5E4LYI5_9HEMI|nr:Hypothetical protein CINCED_3A007785 [Cinara cedri]